MNVLVFVRFVTGFTVGLEYFIDPDGDFNLELNLGLLRVIICWAKSMNEPPLPPPTAPGV